MNIISDKIEGGLRIKGMFYKKNEASRPLVSIITVVLNNGSAIEKTIQSVIRQTYDKIEYILIDGGSTDNTIDVIKKYQNQIAYWVSEKDRGIYDAMNKGIAIAKGDILYFLNSDDIIYNDNVVKEIVDVFNEHEAVGIVYGLAEFYSDNIGVRYIYGKRIDRSTLWKGMPICHQAAFFRKKLFNILGNYDTAFKIAADYEFLIRFIKRSDDIGYADLFVDKIITKFQLFEGKSSRNYISILAEIKQICGQYFNIGLKQDIYYGFLFIKFIFIRLFSMCGLMRYYRKLKYAVVSKFKRKISDL